VRTLFFSLVLDFVGTDIASLLEHLLRTLSIVYILKLCERSKEIIILLSIRSNSSYKDLFLYEFMSHHSIYYNNSFHLCA
jgi:hypothetical protein